MSCHDIGRGMNSVVEIVIQMFDDEEISLEIARELIAACRESVHWCDGSEGEATYSISRCRCGKCLKMIPKGELLYNIRKLSDDKAKNEIIRSRKGAVQLAFGHLCEECFDEIVGEYFNDPKAPEREKRYIKEHCQEEEYTSTGAPEYVYPFHEIVRWKDRD